MKDDRLLDDDDLKAAFRSVRDAYDGTHPEANSTLHRALFRTRTRERRHRFTRWVVVPIAAVLAASTAWAGVTGKLTPAVQSVLESFHAERTAPPSPAPARPAVTSATATSETSETAAPHEDETPAEVAAADVPAPESTTTATTITPPPSARSERVPSVRSSAVDVAARELASKAEAPTEAIVTAETAPPAPPPRPDPHAALFEEAHRLHFIDRDPARALAAWDRYLVTAPNGRFAPEARYNRALALVRLGRVAEAKTELEAFAGGAYGSYRRDEAKALLGALAGDGARP